MGTAVPSGRAAGRRAIVTLSDQGLSSISNFAVGIVIARIAGPVGLGAFSLAYAGWLVLAALHRSLVTDPMAIEGDVREHRMAIGIGQGFAAELALGLVGAIFFAVLGVILLLAHQPTFGIAILAVAPWLPVLIVQDYWRWIGFMTARPQKALVNDLVFDIAQAAAFVLLFATGEHSVWWVITAWGFGGLAGAGYGLRQHRMRLTCSGGITLLKARWALSKWIAGSSLTSSGANQAYVYTAGLILGPAGLGAFKAAQTLVTGPTLVLIQAGGSVGLPEATKAYAEGGWPALARVARVVTAFGTVSALACVGVIAVWGRPLLLLVYGAKFAGLQEAAVLIGIAYVVIAWGLGPILVIKATRNSRWLFDVQLVTLIVTLIVLAPLTVAYGVDGTAGGTIVSAVVMVAGNRWYQRKIRLASVAAPGRPPGVKKAAVGGEHPTPGVEVRPTEDFGGIWEAPAVSSQENMRPEHQEHGERHPSPPPLRTHHLLSSMSHPRDDRRTMTPLTRTLERLVVQVAHLSSQLVGDDWLGKRARLLVLRAAGAQLGTGTRLHGGSYLTAPWRLRAGRGCFVNRACYLDLEGTITLGDHVTIGHGSTLVTTHHEIGPSTCRAGTTSARPIVIGSGAWLGANVSVLPGVTIGAGAVVAAASVVLSDVPPDVLVAGTPARIVRHLARHSGRRDADQIESARARSLDTDAILGAGVRLPACTGSRVDLRGPGG